MALLKRSGATTSAAGSNKRATGSSTSFSDLFGLVVAYLKQETLDPIKQLSQFVRWGLAGALAFSIGTLLILLGVLRLLQTETGSVFSGLLSFVPYVAVVVVAGATFVIAASRVAKGSATKSPAPPNQSEEGH